MEELILKICEHCRHKWHSNAMAPCVDCNSRDKWEVSEIVDVSSKKLKALQQELDSLIKCYEVTNESWKALKQQNKDAQEVLILARQAMKVHLQFNPCDCLKDAIKAIDKIGGGEK